MPSVGNNYKKNSNYHISYLRFFWRKNWQFELKLKHNLYLMIQYTILRCSVMCDSATPWTVTQQAPLSMGFPRPECWSGLPFPSPGNLPDRGIKPVVPVASPALQADSLTPEPPGKPSTWLDFQVLVPCKHLENLKELYVWGDCVALSLVVKTGEQRKHPGRRNRSNKLWPIKSNGILSSH